MSVLMCDDFKGYGTSTAFMLDGLYADVGVSAHLAEDPDPNASGVVFKASTSGARGALLRRVFSEGRNTVGMALRLWLTALPPNNTTIPSFSILNESGGATVSITVDTIGRIRLHTGFGTGTIQSTSAPVLTANAWNHIELKAPTSSVAGVCIVKVNGVTVITTAPLNINAPASQILIDNPYDTPTELDYYVKDLVIWDDLGGDNDDFMGTVQVVSRTVTSDVSLGGWTPSTGTTGYNLLDNSPPVDGTDYVSAPFPPPAPASFTLSALSDDITSVRAMVTQVRARKIDGGDGFLQSSLISSGDTDSGVDRPVTTAFTYYEDIFETDPHTGDAWTPVSADAATIKIDRTV